MGNLIIALIVFLTPCCEKKADFSCVRCEYRQFAGGIVTSPSGTDYFIELQAVRRVKNLIIETVWIGKRKFVLLNIQYEGKQWDEGTVEKDGILKIQFRLLNLPDFHDDATAKDAETDGNISEPPYEYSGKVLIEYSVKGKKKFMEIDELSRLKPLMYP